MADGVAVPGDRGLRGVVAAAASPMAPPREARMRSKASSGLATGSPPGRLSGAVLVVTAGGREPAVARLGAERDGRFRCGLARFVKERTLGVVWLLGGQESPHPGVPFEAQNAVNGACAFKSSQKELADSAGSVKASSHSKSANPALRIAAS